MQLSKLGALVLSFMAAPAFAGQIPDQYIVLLKPNASAAVVSAKHQVKADFVYQAALNGFAGKIPPGQLKALQDDADVAAVLPDQEVYAFAKGGNGGGGTPPPAQTLPEGVKRIGATPGATGFDGAGIGVAVLDTGVDLQHQDLNVSPVTFSGFGGSADDDQGHGTHVAGTIAALNNAVDVVGVAPAATVYAVKILDNTGTGSDSVVIAGLDWVYQNANLVTPPIRVVNMSLGRPSAPGSPEDSAMHLAVQNLVAAGVTVVAAAGNECADDVAFKVPGGFAEVISVASTTAINGINQYRFFNGVITADTASFFTTDGATVTISAPGEDKEDISRSGFISSVGILSTRNGGGTTRMSGTSMAAPHVAGVVALLYQQAGGAITPAGVRSKIVVGATNVGAAPKNSPTSCYTFDGVREGVLSAPGALAAP